MHHPRKRFGQHFLCDQGIIAQILAAIDPKKGESLVEIGPGQGALTVPLLKIAKYLDVIEIDRDLIPELIHRCQPYGELIVHQEDVLKFDFSKLKKSAKKLRVFGNLPYNISTVLLFHLLNYTDMISDMVFMLQKEVAYRLAAKPNDDDYGRLSVMMQYHCNIKLLFNVPAFAFYPPPQVTSSIVRLIPIEQKSLLAQDYQLFSEVVRLAFGQRRKTLRNSLKNIVSDSDWAHMPVHSDLRAENLSVQDFVMISNTLVKKPQLT